jgi:hypothetical protein
LIQELLIVEAARPKLLCGVPWIKRRGLIRRAASESTQE